MNIPPAYRGGTFLFISRQKHIKTYIGYRDSLTGKHYLFLTNQFKLSATTITAIYKERWQIELFSKWIKQNLKIKPFIVTSENAVLVK